MVGVRYDTAMKNHESGEAGGELPGVSEAGLTARTAAVDVLAEVRKGRVTAREVLEGLVARGRLAGSELPLATELVMGVLRHRLTLVCVLSGLTSRGWKRVAEGVQNILLVGAYQIIWLDAVPAFAAVHEAVDAAKRRGGPPAGRFVNAVLRQLLRDIEHRRLSLAEADPCRAIPVDRDNACQFHREVLPEPSRQPVEYLADTTSVPTWLVKRWMSQWGLEQAREAARTAMLRSTTFLRPNATRVTCSAMFQRMVSEGFQAEITADGQMVAVLSGGDPAKSEAFAEGWFQVQDQSSRTVVEQMRLRPGQVVIDWCAGLGTKTTQMAECMRNQGLILASDKDAGKLAALERNCLRLGHTSVRTVLASQLVATAAELKQIDWILIDAPCSNSGVLSRRPEARYRINAAALKSLAEIQHGLLDAASRLARPATRLLYSTCSIEPEENEMVSTRFAHSHPGWRLEAARLALPSAGRSPGEWRDGGYWAIWVREYPPKSG